MDNRGHNDSNQRPKSFANMTPDLSQSSDHEGISPQIPAGVRSGSASSRHSSLNLSLANQPSTKDYNRSLLFNDMSLFNSSQSSVSDLTAHPEGIMDPRFNMNILPDMYQAGGSDNKGLNMNMSSEPQLQINTTTTPGNPSNNYRSSFSAPIGMNNPVRQQQMTNDRFHSPGSPAINSSINAIQTPMTEENTRYPTGRSLGILAGQNSGSSSILPSAMAPDSNIPIPNNAARNSISVVPSSMRNSRLDQVSEKQFPFGNFKSTRSFSVAGPLGATSSSRSTMPINDSYQVDPINTLASNFNRFSIGATSQEFLKHSMGVNQNNFYLDDPNQLSSPLGPRRHSVQLSSPLEDQRRFEAQMGPPDAYQGFQQYDQDDYKNQIQMQQQSNTGMNISMNNSGAPMNMNMNMNMGYNFNYDYNGATPYSPYNYNNFYSSPGPDSGPIMNGMNDNMGTLSPISQVPPMNWNEQQLQSNNQQSQQGSGPLSPVDQLSFQQMQRLQSLRFQSMSPQGRNDFGSSSYGGEYKQMDKRNSKKPSKLRHEQEINKYAKVPFENIVNDIYPLCKDQHGCRFLQKKLSENNPTITDVIFNQTFPFILEFMIDPFGNYLCQKLVEYISDEQKTAVIEKICNSGDFLIKIAINQHGTRSLQKIIEYITPAPNDPNDPNSTDNDTTTTTNNNNNNSDTQQQQLGSSPAPAEVTETSPQSKQAEHHERQIKALINSSLKSNVVYLIKDLNGNHVIQKCLRCLDCISCQFIFDEICENCYGIATHRHGCCVLQRCIDFSNLRQKFQILDNLINCGQSNGIVPRNGLLIRPIGTQGLQQGFNSSNGVSNNNNGFSIGNEEPSFFNLIKDPFGNYVIQYFLQINNFYISKILIDEIVKTGEICSLSKQKFSSNVIEKCIKISYNVSKEIITPDDEGKGSSNTILNHYDTPEGRNHFKPSSIYPSLDFYPDSYTVKLASQQQLIYDSDEIINQILHNGDLAELLNDSYANYVIQTILDYYDHDMNLKNELVLKIKVILNGEDKGNGFGVSVGNGLKNTSYGRRIQAKINSISIVI